MQRIVIGFYGDVSFEEKICKIVINKDQLWKSNWLKNKILKKQMESADIIDRQKLSELVVPEKILNI